MAAPSELDASLLVQPPEGEPQMSEVVVLLVEDEPLVRILFSEVLTEAGFRVLEAANSQEALTILAAKIDVHVIFTDVDLPPGPNGFELAREVARRWPGVEILISSGRRWPDAGDLPTGTAFLEKPVPNEVLVSQVQAAAERALANLGRQQSEVDNTVIAFPKTAERL